MRGIAAGSCVGLLASVMHEGGSRGHQEAFLQDLLKQAADAGAIRTDMPVEELAKFCLNALSAASQAPSHAAVKRLVQLTLDGLRKPEPAG